MSNPFDDPEASFHVLVNEEGQFSLWLAGIPVPAGWSVALGDRGREECVAYVDTHWTDMRPHGLVERMDAAIHAREGA
ncbi:MbtH family NRPS accessory protein [Streptomyces sp. NBC_01537]|uniref:MbtH family protein n=1 Tax=Streptomyces sp. NBC_01537 TaxID=2903896 RepID=UPI003865A299